MVTNENYEVKLLKPVIFICFQLKIVRLGREKRLIAISFTG